MANCAVVADAHDRAIIGNDRQPLDLPGLWKDPDAAPREKIVNENVPVAEEIAKFKDWMNDRCPE